LGKPPEARRKASSVQTQRFSSFYVRRVDHHGAVSSANAVRGRSLAFLAGVDVGEVKDIGPKTAARLAKADIRSVADLLMHVPRRYLDRSQIFDLSAVPLDEEVTVGGVVEKVNRRRISRGRTMITARIRDDSRLLTVMWFNPYIKIHEGDEVVLSGKVELFRGGLQMKSPDFERLGDESLTTGRIVPVHPSVGGLSPFKLRKAIENALIRSRPITEVLPDEIRARYDLIDRDSAVAAIHFPTDSGDADRARRRLVFDEFFRLQVRMAMRKRQYKRQAQGISQARYGPIRKAFEDWLPFEFTPAQRHALKQILGDMKDEFPMHRLLQGEVGSGKTIVALSALLAAVEGQRQGAIMAPTEVLAEQHYRSTSSLIANAGLSPSGGPGESGTGNLFEGKGPKITVALLTANNARVNSSSSATRSQILESIADGTVNIAIGTHSLIQEGLEFDQLGMAVVDEQHRFGVHQRVKLRKKSKAYVPDILIMTATPIPRTLSMTLYGDLDVSVLDEMPPGRMPVATMHVSKDPASLARVHDLVRSEAAAGRQTFVVCPLVEDSDKLEAKSATAEYERLVGVYPDLRVGLLHGQMRSRDKDEVMQRFRRGEIDVLVATTVIEVGIDIPSATVMVIEDADRFGLSQLHQLRGRVGRGEDAATCVLVAEPSTTESEQRIEAMVATTDGFVLARKDLEIRGQGSVFETRQSGSGVFKLADIFRDSKLLGEARDEAFELIERDPELVGSQDLAKEIDWLLGVPDLGEDAEWLERS
jgi:ATP-dependent DNA helicase RecG